MVCESKIYTQIACISWIIYIYIDNYIYHFIYNILYTSSLDIEMYAFIPGVSPRIPVSATPWLLRLGLLRGLVGGSVPVLPLPSPRPVRSKVTKNHQKPWSNWKFMVIFFFTSLRWYIKIRINCGWKLKVDNNLLQKMVYKNPLPQDDYSIAVTGLKFCSTHFCLDKPGRAIRRFL